MKKKLFLSSFILSVIFNYFINSERLIDIYSDKILNESNQKDISHYYVFSNNENTDRKKKSLVNNKIYLNKANERILNKKNLEFVQLKTKEEDELKNKKYFIK